MNITICPVCKMEYVKERGFIDKDHKSYHARFLYMQRKFGKDIILTKNMWRTLSQKGYSLISFNNGDNNKIIEGANLVLLVEFNRFIERTRNYTTYENFIRKYLRLQDFDSEVQAALSFVINK